MKYNYKIFVGVVRFTPKEFFEEFGVPQRTFYHKLAKTIKSQKSDIKEFTMLFKRGENAVSCKIQLK